MTETVFEFKAADKVLNKIGRYTHDGSWHWWVIPVDDPIRYIRVKRSFIGSCFYICRSPYGAPYSGKLKPFELLEELASQFPDIATKLAEPIGD